MVVVVGSSRVGLCDDEEDKREGRPADVCFFSFLEEVVRCLGGEEVNDRTR